MQILTHDEEKKAQPGRMSVIVILMYIHTHMCISICVNVCPCKYQFTYVCTYALLYVRKLNEILLNKIISICNLKTFWLQKDFCTNS